jgi:predicted amidohydrolase YtcJ
VPFPYSDRIFINGRIHTLTKSSAAPAEALAVHQGRIVAVGRTDEIRKFAGSRTETVDLQGKTVLPGFIDAHMHLVSAGLLETGYILDLSDARSLVEALEKIRVVVRQKSEGQWLRGRGWDESYWPEKRYLTRADLDPVAPRTTLALSRVDGHLLVANSDALKHVSISAHADEFDPQQGWVRESAVTAFLNQIPTEPQEIEQAVRAATRLAHSLGITSVHDIVRAEHIRAYQHLHRRGELQLRIRMNPIIEHLRSLAELGLGSEFGDEFLKLGAIKLFADGSIGARNAALFEPYADAPTTKGKLNYPQEELNGLVRRTHEAGFQIMVHAIGDRAIEAALDAIARSGAGPDDRPRIEHFELATPEQIQRCKEMGIIASMQPNFLEWSGAGKLYEMRLGTERDRRIDPHRLVLERGAPLAFGSDGMPFGPLFGVHSAVNASYESQRLSVEEALRAYTLGATYAGFAKTEVGSLEVGKWADLIILSDDPYAMASERLANLEVLQTYLAGQLVFARERLSKA